MCAVFSGNPIDWRRGRLKFEKHAMEKIMTETETNDSNRETYLAERKLLIELECESARTFDKAMITLSAGALGLSITFIKQVAPMPLAGCLLYVAWGGFILALLSTLSSFLFSQSAMRKQREILDEYQPGKQSLQNHRNLYAVITKYLNWLSIVFFIIGIVYFTWFSIKNLPAKEEAMNKSMIIGEEQASEEPPEQRVLVPPNLPVKPQQPKPFEPKKE